MQEQNLMTRSPFPTAVVLGPDALFVLSKWKIPTLSKGNPSQKNYKCPFQKVMILYVIHYLHINLKYKIFFNPTLKLEQNIIQTLFNLGPKNAFLVMESSHFRYFLKIRDLSLSSIDDTSSVCVVVNFINLSNYVFITG